jgi:hypothetical protein
MSAWPTIESDIRRALLRRGSYVHEVDGTLDALRPIVLAVERAGTRIDQDIAWCLLAMLADQQHRRIQAERSRRPPAAPPKIEAAIP